MVHGYGQVHAGSQTSLESASDYSSLVVVSGFLNAALRMWDDDRIRAKSQVKVAAAMLRGYTDEPMTDRGSAATAPDRRSLAPWQTRKVKEFIDASLDCPIRLRDCASKVRLSVSYFSHAFKVTFGTTACHYIRRRRIERAQQLMLESTAPQSQIALACGFADQAHYCRVFRDVVGLSPTAWRRRNVTMEPDE
jgi:AraC family transcriptional regulator